MIKVVIYCRVSTEGQERDGISQNGRELRSKGGVYAYLRKG